jgi:hypothetical protein
VGRCHTQPVMQSHGFTWCWNYYIKFYEKVTLSNLLLIVCSTVTAGSTICTYRTSMAYSQQFLNSPAICLLCLEEYTEVTFQKIGNVIKSGFSCCWFYTFISIFHYLLLWISQVLNHNSSNNFLNLWKSTDF